MGWWRAWTAWRRTGARREGCTAAGIESLLVPVQYGPWNDFVSGRARELWLKGGRGSIKSTLASYLVAASVMANRNMSAMVLRKHGEDLKSSVYPQICKAIERIDALDPSQGILKRWRFRTSPMDMTFDGRRSIIFHGLDDPRKRKSETPPHGYFGCLWLEELDEFSGMGELSSLRKSVLRGGPIGQSIYTFNPPESTAAWVNAEAQKSKPGRFVYHSTYLDVAAYHPEWLGDTFLRDAEELRRTDERRYRWELLGESVGAGGEIFTNVCQGEVTDAMIARFRERGMARWGMDFGFTNDPTVLVECAYDAAAKTLYVYGEWRKYGQFTDQIFEEIERRGLLGEVIVADSAEGRVIGELNYRGAKVRPCWKSPKGWREDGIRFLRSRLRIVIDSRRAPGAWDEFRLWEFGRYGNGTLRTEYPDGNDHAIDAVRYALEDAIKAEVMRRHVAMPTSFERRR